MKKPSCDIHASYSRGCSECNRVYHAALNAALARAMGMEIVNIASLAGDPIIAVRLGRFQPIALKLVPIAGHLCDDADGLFWPPDFCNDPAASRKLVAWLAEQDDAVRARFDDAIEHAVAPYGGFTPLEILVTPLPTIAQAAAVALGIEVEQ